MQRLKQASQTQILHQRRDAKFPRWGLVAIDNLIFKHAQFVGADAHYVADLMGEAHALAAPILCRCKESTREEHEAVGILVVFADGLVNELEHIATDHAHMAGIGEGELFAWSSLVEPYRYTSNAMAATDCELIAFDANKLRVMCEEDVELGHQVLSKIVELLSNRLESVRVQLAAS